MLSSNLTRHQVDALINLRNSNNDVLLSIFREDLAQAISALTKADDMMRVHRLQGRIAFLEEFINNVDNAPDYFRTRPR